MTEWRLPACGVVIGGAFVALVWLNPGEGTRLFFWILAVAAAAYAAAFGELLGQRFPSRRMLFWCLVLALMWRLPLAFGPVGHNSDVFRYIWDARVQRAGLNPFVVRSTDPDVARLHTAITRGMNNPGVASPYPPAAQLFFRAATTFDESVRSVKLALLGCEVLLAIVLARWLAVRGLNAGWLLAYAWSPLVTLETARHGHFDVFGALLLCLAALALSRGRGLRASLWFALAVAAKFLPIVLVPLFWKRVRARDAASGALALIAVSVPFATGWRMPLGSVPDVVIRFRFNAPGFELMAQAAGIWGATAMAIAAGSLTCAVLRRRTPAHAPQAWAWPMAVALAFSPLVYPWYLVWLAPFLTAPATVPLVVWTVSILPVYIVWHTAAGGGGMWRVPDAVLAMEYGLPIAAIAWLAWRAKRLHPIAPGGYPAASPTSAGGATASRPRPDRRR